MASFPRISSAHPSRTRARGAAVVAALVAAPLLLPAAADARTVTADNVYAYGSGEVSCFAVRYGSGIECSSQAVPAKFTDGYLGLKRTGRARLGERGDFPGYTSKRVKLRVGDRWRPRRTKARGIVCELQSQGLRCENRSDHGFLLEPGAYRRF